MKKISASVPDKLLDSVDKAAENFDQSRSQFFRQALEYYLAGLDDQNLGTLAMPDPNLLALDWDDVEHTLLSSD